MAQKIKDRADAERIIDRIGDNLQKVKELQTSTKALKAAYEAWANANPQLAFDGKATTGATARFAYTMKPATPALKVLPHLETTDVVTRLKGSTEMAVYVLETYDAAAIKDDFGRNAESRRAVEDFGLYFTKPTKRSLSVEKLTNEG